MAGDSTAQCRVGEQAFHSLQQYWNLKLSGKCAPSQECTKKRPSEERKSQSLSEAPFDTAQIIHQDVSLSSKDTVLYLAYGSNLSAETFKGTRGVQPLSQTNVLVPELELTFDLPGIPYQEPCFANTRYRRHEKGISQSGDYHKDRWTKGLVGVVYEVTKADYVTIIATEGGGTSYQDILVEAFEIPEGTELIDPHPNNGMFKVHTLYSPALELPPPGTLRSRDGGRIPRPDPSYSQASARYLKLITDGASEHALPQEYQNYLHDLRPYMITTKMQQVGRAIFLAIWLPIFLPLVMLAKVVADKNGKVPKWYASIMSITFTALWSSYDNVFKNIFGDGERTQKSEGDEEAVSTEKLLLMKCGENGA